MKKISVIGFGSWGIALASVLCKNGHNVLAWDSNADYVAQLAHTRRNSYLPEIVVPSCVAITDNFEIAAKHADIFVFATTSSNICTVAPIFAP